MKNKKRHKLLLITPSGKEYKIGFLSPCKNGFVLGNAKAEDVETSHLTVIVKDETLSSHITSQDGMKKRQYFPSLEIKDIGKKLQTLVEDNLIAPLPPDELSKEVFYLTKDLENWFNRLQATFYQEKESPKEVIHILNFKKLSEEIPQLFEKIMGAPSSFFGLCKAKEILEDEIKIAGITESRVILIPFEDQLYGINLPLLTNFGFNPTLEEEELSAPLDELFSSMGILQYITEAGKKDFVKKIFSKEQTTAKEG
jgi:hypothetical protein